MSGSDPRPGRPIGSANADGRKAATTAPAGEGGTAVQVGVYLPPRIINNMPANIAAVPANRAGKLASRR